MRGINITIKCCPMLKLLGEHQIEGANQSL
jgi:hypothetical protein